MDALTEAIKNAYAQQRELIAERDRQLTLLNSIFHEMRNGFLQSCLTGELHRIFGPKLAQISTIIQALEGVRDAQSEKVK
jgi:hypothetical protein